MAVNINYNTFLRIWNHTLPCEKLRKLIKIILQNYIYRGIVLHVHSDNNSNTILFYFQNATAVFLNVLPNNGADRKVRTRVNISRERTETVWRGV